AHWHVVSRQHSSEPSSQCSNVAPHAAAITVIADWLMVSFGCVPPPLKWLHIRSGLLQVKHRQAGAIEHLHQGLRAGQRWKYFGGALGLGQAAPVDNIHPLAMRIFEQIAAYKAAHSAQVRQNRLIDLQEGRLLNARLELEQYDFQGGVGIHWLCSP